MTTDGVLPCHSIWCLPPYRVLSVVFLLKLVGWLKRGVTLCFVTRKKLNSPVLSWVAGVTTLDKNAEATVGMLFVAKKNKQLHIIFDTRCVNVLFREPDHTTLLTASSFKSIGSPFSYAPWKSWVVRLFRYVTH